MSQINKDQGAIKLSEVSVDNAQEVIDTQDREDALTAFEELLKATTDSLRKTSMLLISDGVVTWNNGNSQELWLNNSVSIILKLLLNPASAAARTINIRYTGQANQILNGATANASRSSIRINDGDVLYIELNRDLLNAAAPNLDLDFSTPGQRLVVYPQGSMPVLDSDSTISIPLALRQDGGADVNLWWRPSGILWSNTISSYLGQIFQSNSMPLGTILLFHRPDGSTNPIVTQSDIDNWAPGFQLCNGSLITNPSSPFQGFYVPNLIGVASPQSGLNANEGRTYISPSQNSPSGSTAYAGPRMPNHTHTMANAGLHDHFIRGTSATNANAPLNSLGVARRNSNNDNTPGSHDNTSGEMSTKDGSIGLSIPHPDGGVRNYYNGGAVGASDPLAPVPVASFNRAAATQTEHGLHTHTVNSAGGINVNGNRVEPRYFLAIPIIRVV